MQLSKYWVVLILELYSEKQIGFLWNWVFKLESIINWVFAVLKWVFVKFILGKTTFLLYFFMQPHQFQLGIQSFLCLMILFDLKMIGYTRKMIGYTRKNDWVYQKNDWVYQKIIG